MFFAGKKGFYSQQFEHDAEAIRNEEYQYLSRIFCIFTEQSDTYKLKAALVLKSILNKLTIREIERIDIQMRETTSMEWFIDWNKQKLSNFMTKKMSEEERGAVLAFASCNPNGYIREQAVNALAYYKNSLPFLLLRCNDWVSQVRKVAETAVQQKLENATEQEILFALPLIEKLYRSERCNYNRVLSSMIDVFGKKESLIPKALRSPDARIRRNCVSLLEQTSIPYEKYLTKHMKYEKDPYIRRMIFQKFLTSSENSWSLIELGLNDKNAFIRRMALQYLYEHHLDKAITVSERMLLDKNASIRDWARWIIAKQRNEFDFHQFYLIHMDSSTAVCLYGLGEVGTSIDCPMIERFVHDTDIHKARAAMCALMNLEPDSYISQVTELLLSEKPGIVKMAWMLLKKNGEFDFERVYQIQAISSYEYTKIKCISLLYDSPMWKRLIYLLMILGSDSQAIERECVTRIKRWHDDFNQNSNYLIVLPEEDKRTIHQLLNDKKCFLEPEIMEQIQFVCR